MGPRPAAFVVALWLALPGCAITALVGENPDAARVDRAVPTDVVAMDLVAPMDAVAMDVVAPMDNEAVRPDLELRDRPTAAIDGGAPGDVPLGIGDAAAVAEAGGSPTVDAEPELDAMQTIADSGLGAPCRRDADCLPDLVRPFCSLSFQRCAVTP